MRALVPLAIAFACVAPGCARRAPVPLGCEVLGPSSGGESLASMYARVGAPILVADDVVLHCPCGDPGGGEGRDLAGAGEGRDLAGGGEARDLAGADEGRDLAGAGEGRDLAGAGEGRDLAGDGEGRALAGSGEARDLGGAAEGRALAGASEDRWLAGGGEAFTCRAEPACGGYSVSTRATLQVYDGRALREVPSACVTP